MIANFATLADEAAKTAGDQNVKGSVHQERKFWTLARDQGSGFPFSSEIELV